MPTFEFLFGQPVHSIQKTCVLAPMINKGMLESLGVRQMQKGQPYSSGNNHCLTLIHSHIGAAFTGDCVLYLKDSPCENLILFGSCGLVEKNADLNIGAIVCPDQVVEMESFSSLLNNKYSRRRALAKPNARLFHQLTDINSPHIHIVTGATLGSIALEDAYKKWLKEKPIHIVEIECSAFFLAAQKNKKHAAALFYVTDILCETNPYPQRSLHEQSRVQCAVESACRMINALAENIS